MWIGQRHIKYTCSTSRGTQAMIVAPWKLTYKFVTRLFHFKISILDRYQSTRVFQKAYLVYLLLFNQIKESGHNIHSFKLSSRFISLNDTKKRELSVLKLLLKHIFIVACLFSSSLPYVTGVSMILIWPHWAFLNSNFELLVLKYHIETR